MEIATLGGLLGLSYLVTRLSGKTAAPAEERVQMPAGAASLTAGYSISPDGQPQRFTGAGAGAIEGFLPAARAPDRDVLTQTPKGASAVGFGPELDMMYQYPNGQTYPSEPHPGPYGQPLGYATQRPPTAPASVHSGQFSPNPSPLEVNRPMVEMRSDGVEEEPVYSSGNYVVSPLSGQKVPSKDYRHNNMVPFFGGRIKQNIAPQQNQGILDAYNGSGSTQIRKREVETMFETSRAPYGNPFGMEDNTDFFQSRVQEPISRNGERPFEPVHIGPGLGEKFGLTGKGGFQQMDVNEIMRPKDTDQLRTANNPKQTFNAPVVPGQRFVANPSNDPGEVRKYKPDRFYIDETGERFFVTNGELIKESIRPVQILPFTSRPETSVEYGGIASSQDFGESYTTGSYRLPMTQQYGGTPYRNANLETYNTKAVDNENADYGRHSIEIRPNERAETSERVIATNVAPADTGNVTQPFTDLARPTRRAETSGAIRITGTPVRYAGGSPMVTVWDPQDVARTTVKETTINWGFDRAGIAAIGSAPERLKVYDPDDIARPTQKSQLSANLDWYGPGKAASQDSYDPIAAYNMRLNPNKELIARGRKPIAGSGLVSTMNGDPGVQNSKKLDTDVINDRPMAVNRPIGGGGMTAGVGDIGRVEFRVPLKMDVSRQRNMYDIVSAVDNNPLMQSLHRNAVHDERVLHEMQAATTA